MLGKKKGVIRYSLKGSSRISHIISYFPDGEIQMKENICSCRNCLNGEFIRCPFSDSDSV